MQYKANYGTGAPTTCCWEWRGEMSEPIFEGNGGLHVAGGGWTVC